MNAETQKTIFVVDYSATGLYVTQRALEKQYRVSAFSSAIKMFAGLEKSKPDLILLSVAMPEMDGFETIKRLKAHDAYAKIPVIFLAGPEDTESEAVGFELGAVDFIREPYNLSVLLARIKHHLAMIEKLSLLEGTNGVGAPTDEDCINRIAGRCPHSALNDLRLAKMNLMVKAAKIGLWDMEVLHNGPLESSNSIMWSAEFRQMLGFNDESDFPNILSSWSDLLHPDDRESVLNAFNNHLLDKTGETPYDIEYRLLKKNGEYAYYRDFGATIRDENGNAVRVTGALIDITKAKNLLLDLEHESLMLHTMFDSVSDLIFCKDMDLNYTRCNESLLRYFGLKEEELIGSDDESGLGLPPKIAEEFRATDRAVINGGNAVTYEEYVPAADGSLRFFETNKVPLVLNGKAIGVMGIARDITGRKAMDAAAQKASRAKSSFLAHMSHEMRTPLNSIIGFSELALDGEIALKNRDYINLIIDNSKWLLQLINDILDISKIESGSMKLEYAPFDLHEMFTACKTMITPKAVEKNIELFFYAEPFIGKMLIGDSTRLRQILINLLSNAVKFTEKGAVKLAALVVNKTGGATFGKDSRTLRFEIKDTGIGMTAQQIEKVSEPFMQADVSTTRRYGGTGLGLSITKNLIEMMGGKLNIESEPGVGTKASFELAFDLVDMGGVTVKGSGAVNEIKKPLFKGDVLVCEDNAMNRRVMFEHLTRVGLGVKIAVNGSDGVESVRRRMERGLKPFDLILMDIYMPVMDGIEAASKIIELGVATPVIAVTANVMKDDVELYKKLGMHDHLGKPFTSQELWRFLLKYLQPVGVSSTGEPERQKADDKLLNQLKSDFVKRSRNIFQEIAGALNAGDIKLAHRLAHTLKNSAGLIGKITLQKAAADIENSLKDGEDLVSEAQKSLLQTELRAALEELKPFLIETENAGKAAADAAAFDALAARALFNQLEPLLKSGNLECLKLADGLRSIPGSGKLLEQMEDFDFGAAMDTLNALKAKIEG